MGRWKNFLSYKKVDDTVGIYFLDIFNMNKAWNY